MAPYREIDPRSLQPEIIRVQYTPEGNAKTMLDAAGAQRYLLSNGHIDPRSVVDERFAVLIEADQPQDSALLQAGETDEQKAVVEGADRCQFLGRMTSATHVNMPSYPVPVAARL